MNVLLNSRVNFKCKVLYIKNARYAHATVFEFFQMFLSSIVVIKNNELFSFNNYAKFVERELSFSLSCFYFFHL